MNNRRFNGAQYLSQHYPDKAFHFGECSSFGPSVVVTNRYGTNVLKRSLTTTLDNYETSFHNMIWATAFSGCLQPGQTWQFDVVHWWPNATPVPIAESFNPNPTNVLHQDNFIQPATYPTFPVTNKKTYHHYKHLVNFFQTSGIDLVNTNYIPHKIYDATSSFIECYYLVKDDSNGIGDHAYGWVHNVNKYWGNHWYHSSIGTDENYFGCLSTQNPDSDFTLFGFDQTIQYDIEIFPTGEGQTLPTGSVINSAPSSVTVNLSSSFLACDSINSDFAFKIYPHGQFRTMHPLMKTTISTDSIFSFIISPNPNQGIFDVIIQLAPGADYDLYLFDAIGRTVVKKSSQRTNVMHLDLNNLPKGIYCIRVDVNKYSSYKRIIVQ